MASPSPPAPDEEPTGPVPTPEQAGPTSRAKPTRKRRKAGRRVQALWLPAVILIVVGLVSYGVTKVRQNSDLITHPPTDDSIAATIVEINPKNITYEVFGTLGNGGKVVYADLNSQPVEVKLDALPWSYSLTTMAASVSLSLVTHVAGDAVGCRILVNGQVRDEQSVNHDSAAAACTVTAA
jgi:Mycobacterium membrane protein